MRHAASRERLTLALGNRPCNPNILPQATMFYLGGYETEHSQECGDSAVERNPDTLSHVCEADEENVVNDVCHETEQSDEFVVSVVEALRNSKRMRVKTEYSFII